MSSTGADIVLGARTESLHDSDTQVTDAQCFQQLGLEHQRLRRWLFDISPELCRVRTGDLTVSSGASAIAKSAISPATGYQFERVWLIERKIADYWVPLTMLETLNANFDTRYTLNYPESVAWQEFPSSFELAPSSSAPGTYRVTYLAGVTKDMDAATVIKLPDGIELVLQHRLAGFIRARLDDRYTYSAEQEKTVLREFVRSIRNRNGAHPKPGLSRKFGVF